jgi:hypothetical protein
VHAVDARPKHGMFSCRGGMAYIYDHLFCISTALHVLQFAKAEERMGAEHGLKNYKDTKP